MTHGSLGITWHNTNDVHKIIIIIIKTDQNKPGRYECRRTEIVCTIQAPNLSALIPPSFTKPDQTTRRATNCKSDEDMTSGCISLANLSVSKSVSLLIYRLGESDRQTCRAGDYRTAGSLGGIQMWSPNRGSEPPDLIQTPLSSSSETFDSHPQLYTDKGRDLCTRGTSTAWTGCLSNAGHQTINLLSLTGTNGANPPAACHFI